MDCRNSNESSKVAQGTMGTSPLQLRVMMPDGSDCMFNGRLRRDRIEGGYLVERGIWRASGSY